MNFSLTTSGELLLRASWQAGILAVIIFVAQWLAASRISARWRYYLWMLIQNFFHIAVLLRHHKFIRAFFVMRQYVNSYHSQLFLQS